MKSQYYNDPLTRPSFPHQRRWDRWMIASFVLSLLLHVGFFQYSIQYQVASVQQIESEIEQVFRMDIQQLESREYVSRPTSEQLQKERERLLEEEINAISEFTPQSIDDEIETITPVQSAQSLPTSAYREDGDIFQNDQPSQNLITSAIGKRAVRQFEQEIATDVVQDLVDTSMPLTGRGSGTQTRLIDDLPEPELPADPMVSNTISTVLNKSLPPPSPDLDISEPPIELPPVTELLPSPELANNEPGPATLIAEELAIQDIKDRFIPLDDLLNVELFTHHHVGGDGYFMVRIRPITADDRLQVLPKDVILVLDASGSMGRSRIETIKDQMKIMLDRLRPQDRFNVVGFKQKVRKFTDTLVPATQNYKDTAWRFIRPLQASGRTDIYSSLEPLVRLGTERARPLTILLISDGRPTVGVVNSRKIINNLTRYQGPSTSIYCIGTGNTVNQYLLDMLAFQNRGMLAIQQDKNELPVAIQSVYGFIEDPVLLQVSANFSGVDSVEIYPKKLPHLHLKGEIKIWGRLRGEKKFSLRVVGQAFDERKDIIRELIVPERDNHTFDIARQWAFHKIYHLVGKMVETGEQPELIEQIRFLSRTYNIVTPYSEQFTD
jgi:uncharacterized protein YegL